MNPRIEILEQKILVGVSCQMSVVENKTGLLWKSFIPVITSIEHRIGTDKYSLQIYPSDYFKAFNPNVPFTKWAGIEVSKADEVNPELEVLVIPAGLYAIFG